jgi:hypothetical protein
MHQMTLFEVVSRLDEFDDNNDLLTIYAVEPWRPESEAVVTDQPEDGDTSITFKTESGADAAYFLEVFVAKDVLCGWRKGGYRSSIFGLPAASLDEDCKGLIHYALHDG